MSAPSAQGLRCRSEAGNQACASGRDPSGGCDEALRSGGGRTQIIGMARAKGFRNRVTWTVTTWDPPHEMAMSGSGKGGAKYAVTLTVRPTDQGSTLGLRLELGGRALFGPVGSAAARAVKGDVQKSLKNFVELYAHD
ncbi:hypothetical protein BST14_01710 [Mycobacterium arosiense ATCC BAA-1401 = DSM 45069]|uniref:Polyketide cyclase / dehydrase and lipid transport n=1 Tax=Mycobacterium arosiense ATCC BAA-1401 = DSM 45069 TaxID=1265311 RepID=A0A1W9ZSV0_MYCAI|nr:SRPBCC family protein [Mycobacterium arosiense]ORA20718.1 hypothetical protein BST14_01710 [Mycobacterium arosiense ATCC BAA-1401 = DSM 45069]